MSTDFETLVILQTSPLLQEYLMGQTGLPSRNQKSIRVTAPGEHKQSQR
jgi:hypothetical protein